MGDGSTIEWTDATWNPVAGCSVASPGCDHCYAAREASGGLKNKPQYQGLAENGVFNGTIRLLPERFDQPVRWGRPRRVFVNSMSDLFHPAVPDDFRLRVWQTMAIASHHQFQILTKRPEAMARFSRRLSWGGPAAEEPYLSDADPLACSAFRDRPLENCEEPLPNVWLGTSIETNRYVWRVDRLRTANAAVRFLSLEPLLGPLPSLDLTGIDWVIVGGESGPGARPMHPDWAREIRDRCVEASVPFMFKQWGTWAPDDELDRQSYDDHVRFTNEEMWFTDHPDDASLLLWRWRGKAPFRTLDGRTWDEYPR